MSHLEGEHKFSRRVPQKRLTLHRAQRELLSAAKEYQQATGQNIVDTGSLIPHMQLGIMESESRKQRINILMFGASAIRQVLVDMHENGEVQNQT